MSEIAAPVYELVKSRWYFLEYVRLLMYGREEGGREGGRGYIAPTPPGLFVSSLHNDKFPNAALEKFSFSVSVSACLSLTPPFLSRLPSFFPFLSPSLYLSLARYHREIPTWALRQTFNPPLLSALSPPFVRHLLPVVNHVARARTLNASDVSREINWKQINWRSV